MVLTASRPGEARAAEWPEVSLDTREWCIPAERMKNNAEHLVPLSDAAVRVLQQAELLRDGSELVFPSALRAGIPISDNTLSKLLRELAIDAVPHGFRASFRTWAEETTETPHAVMELALAHTVGSAVERALCAFRPPRQAKGADGCLGQLLRKINLKQAARARAII